MIRLHTSSTVWAEVHRLVSIYRPNRHCAGSTCAGGAWQLTHRQIGISLRSHSRFHADLFGTIIDSNRVGAHLSHPGVDNAVTINTHTVERPCYIGSDKDQGCHAD